MVSRLRALLGGELIGVYAGGSFVLGGYTPERSDLDVAAVCRDPLAAERKVEIAEALRHESLPCPARGLEFVLYPESSVREPTADTGFELDLNSGRAMPFRLAVEPSGVDRHWYVIDRAILRDHGQALFGPPPGELFALISRETLLHVLSESVRWHARNGQGVARDDDAVLNACRASRYAAEGAWSSKRDAGEWARARLDDSDLISEALAARFGDGHLDRERVEAFLERVQRSLDTTVA